MNDSSVKFDSKQKDVRKEIVDLKIDNEDDEEDDDDIKDDDDVEEGNPGEQRISGLYVPDDLLPSPSISP